MLFHFSNNLHYISDFCLQVNILEFSCLNERLVLCLLDVLAELIVDSKQLLLVSLRAEILIVLGHNLNESVNVFSHHLGHILHDLNRRDNFFIKRLQVIVKSKLSALVGNLSELFFENTVVKLLLDLCYVLRVILQCLLALKGIVGDLFKLLLGPCFEITRVFDSSELSGHSHVHFVQLFVDLIFSCEVRVDPLRHLIDHVL